MHGSSTASASGWSRARWAGAALLVFAGQVTAVWLLGERGGVGARVEPARFRVTLPQQDGRGLGALAGVSPFDPTLMALPHPAGFSGTAWMNPPPPAYAFPGRKDEPRWLDPAVAEFGARMADYLGTNTAMLLAGVPLHQPQLTRAGGGDSPLRTRSIVRVEGEISRRGVLELPQPPSLVSSSLLPDTAVEIWVNREGLVVTARLADTTAATNPDRRAAALEALRLARKAIFAPVNRGASPRLSDEELAAGRLVFQWHTTPPPPANP